MFRPGDEIKTWQLVRETRAELYSFLAKIELEQWNTTSLCEGWRVRDVLAHLILEYHYSVQSGWLDFLRSKLNINTFLRKTASNYGQASPARLLAEFQDMIAEQHVPRAVSPLNVLVDLLVHEQDIRIPLGQLKPMSMDALTLIFSHWEPHKYNAGEKIVGLRARVKGLAFEITDIGVTIGQGLRVSRAAEDILLRVLGRTVSPERLTGPGAKVLLTRK